ncbi:MAG: hypothetical protein CM1200mP39_28130 [Dehalococcoidia bacterium]|nr:MAG: hypothetical protein CM1200mP39_28130 [Dehalococcoidia bacterium]
MVAAFYLAQNNPGGEKVIAEADRLAAVEVLNGGGAKVVFHQMFITARNLAKPQTPSLRESNKVPDDELILDIGPRSCKSMHRSFQGGKESYGTVQWVGFEWPASQMGLLPLQTQSPPIPKASR